MKNIKVTLKTLFEFLEAVKLPLNEFKEVAEDISVKTPNGEFTPLLGVIRKNDLKIRITTEKGKTVVCGSKHIFLDENDNEVFCKDAINIKTVGGLETIVSKETLSSGDVYDVAIDAPHLYVTPNGMIHHNTTFIKNLIHRSKRNAKVTYDEKTMTSDSFFASFMEEDAGFLIMEDADAFLSKRTDGNTMMHKFLNVSDGLISAPDKKLVFSTNLESVKSIDDALTRPGRCFATVTFRALTNEEAQQVVEEVGYGVVPDKKNIMLAEIFSKQPVKQPKAKNMGFV